METLLYTDSRFVIAYKPHGIPTVPLKSQSMEGTLLGIVATMVPNVLDIAGKNAWEYGAVHRLDTATAGLVIFAKTQEFYDHLQEMQLKDRFSKTYHAKTTRDDRLKGLDFPDGKDTLSIQSYFRAFGPGAKQVRPTTDPRRADSQVLYYTKAKRLDDGFECTITRGFRHQIRAHLAWTGNPIIGDSLYGTGTEDQILELECTGVRFPLPDGSMFSYAL